MLAAYNHARILRLKSVLYRRQTKAVATCSEFRGSAHQTLHDTFVLLRPSVAVKSHDVGPWKFFQVVLSAILHFREQCYSLSAACVCGEVGADSRQPPGLGSRC